MNSSAGSGAFVHLHLHSEYSVSRGIIRIPELIQRCRKQQMPAIALTDSMNLFGLVKFYLTAREAGIKPICGVSAEVNEGGTHRWPLILLVQNQRGYRHLTSLLSHAYDDSRCYGSIDGERLEAQNEGLLLLLGQHSAYGQQLLHGRDRTAAGQLDGLLGIWSDRLYLEVMRTGRTDDERFVEMASQVAASRGVPVVASNDAHFIDRDEYEVHEARTCIAEGYLLSDKHRPGNYSEEQYLRTALEMRELFDDIPGVLENSLDIARRCNLELEMNRPSLPVVQLVDNESAGDALRKQALEGLQQRFQHIDRVRHPDYQQRLESELEVIANTGFEGYFLIVAEFVGWAHQQHIAVGPGRGSGAGSVVAWALNITNVDPIEYDLLFERFLNPERISMPDMDIDFCVKGRDRVINHVTACYGRDRVAQIATFGTMAARAAVKDACRVLGHPVAMGERIALAIPNEVGIRMQRAFEESEELRGIIAEEEARGDVWELALRLEGLVRNVGRHAGGVVIAPSALTDFVPLYRIHADDQQMVQFDKDDAERIGLVKFDFLGLRNLTLIELAVEEINRARTAGGEVPLVIADIPLDDTATFNILSQGDTTAIFQLESAGVRGLLMKLKPDRLSDLVAVEALYRPGPLASNMHTAFVERRHQRQDVAYPHPLLEPVLRGTYGLFIYQEQVMQAAQVLAGFTLGQADVLRRAMGKKDGKLMEEQRERFLEGAAHNDLNARLASNIFDTMEGFSEYGFNKSHAVAYAIISYQTAWIKANHPAAFYAAAMTTSREDTDVLRNLCRDAHRRGLRIQPPNINISKVDFHVGDEQCLHYGLSAIRGVGESVASQIVAAREQGPYTSLYDLCQRLGQLANQRVLQVLINAGALDALGPNRPSLLASVATVLQALQQRSRNAESGSQDLFGGLEEQEIAPRAGGDVKLYRAAAAGERAAGAGVFSQRSPA